MPRGAQGKPQEGRGGSKICAWRGFREGFLEEATPQLTWPVSEGWTEGDAFQADGTCRANSVASRRQEAAVTLGAMLAHTHLSGSERGSGPWTAALDSF